MKTGFCDRWRIKLLCDKTFTKSTFKKVKLAFLVKCLEITKKLLERKKNGNNRKRKN